MRRLTEKANPNNPRRSRYSGESAGTPARGYSTAVVAAARRGSLAAAPGSGPRTGHDLAVVGDPVAVRAAQFDVDLRTAVAVGHLQRRPLGAGQVPVAPLLDRGQHRIEVEPLGGEPVLVPDPRARLLVGLAVAASLTPAAAPARALRRRLILRKAMRAMGAVQIPVRYRFPEPQQ